MPEVSRAWLTQRSRADSLISGTIAAARSRWAAWGYDALIERSETGEAIADTWNVCGIGMDPACTAAPSGGFPTTALVYPHAPHAPSSAPGGSRFTVVEECGPALTLYEFWHWEDGNELPANPGTLSIGPGLNAWGAGQTSTQGGAEGTSYASGLGNDQGSQDVAAVAGTSYQFSGYFHRFNEDVRIEVLWYDAAGALLQTDLIAYNSFWPVGWNAWENTVTAPASAANMQLRARTEASGGVGATGWIDQVRIYVVN